MGFSITWCAVREEQTEDLLRRLHLSSTDAVEDTPDSLISTGRLDTGWRLLWYNRHGCPFLSPKALGDLSRALEILVCLVEEHVMASSAEFWSGGRRVWWISHEAEKGLRHIEAQGSPPESYPVIRRRMEETQQSTEGADYFFEIPLKVAEDLVGFKHDEKWSHLVNGQFVVLERTAPRGNFLQRLFGRR